MAGTKSLFGTQNFKAKTYLVISEKSITIPFSQVYELTKFSLSPNVLVKT